MLEERVGHDLALQEILAAVGYAVWQSQILERTVAYHLVMVYGEADEKARTHAAEAFSVADKTTLGAVLSRIKKVGPRDSDLFERLDAFRERRNWLVHHSRHEHPSAVYDPSAKLELMTILEEIGSAAAPLAKEVQDVTDDYLVSSGMRNREELAESARRILQSWHRPNAVTAEHRESPT
jgi:hypothetical protein